MANVEQLLNAEVQGWLLTREVGRGADGIVYAGRKGGQEAAIKVFFPEALAKNGAAAARERLELQLALIGKKHHPNLVEVFGGGEDPALGTLFLVMELVPGMSLDKLIGSLPREVIAPLAGQLASVAAYLDEQELVHRDIKPANIVISDDLQRLTLLDLGIVHQLAEDEQGRLSDGEFVATLRYSPPEFVWRTEQEEIEGAWLSVTFYQIGATLHDMIMGKPLFAGYDKPRACLYDAVRDRTPTVECREVDGWLIQVTQSCLLKDWRQRLQLVSWDAFSAPVATTDPRQQEKRIRLRQIRNEEMRQAAARQQSKAPSPTREQQIWNLNNLLNLELRNYLLSSQIYPQCKVVDEVLSGREYATHLQFDCDPTRDFPPDVVFSVTLGVASNLEEATKLSFVASVSGITVFEATWSEMYTVDTAFSTCRRSFLDAVESISST